MSVMSIPRIFPLQRHGFFMAAALEVEVARWILEVLHSEQESLTHYQQSDVRFFPPLHLGAMAYLGEQLLHQSQQYSFTQCTTIPRQASASYPDSWVQEGCKDLSEMTLRKSPKMSHNRYC